MSSRRGKSRAADQEEAGDGYNWSEWGWDEKAKREGRYRLNSKGKYVYQYRKQKPADPRNTEQLSSIPSQHDSTTSASQEYCEGGQENYHWSPQTSQSIDRLTEEFDNTSIGHAGVTAQDSYRDSSPLVDSTTGPGTSQPIETPSSPWRPTATAAEFVPSSREGGYFASSNSYTSGMNPDPHGMVGPSQDHHQATQQYNRGYDGGYDDDSSVMSSSVETVVPSRRRRHAASSSMNPRNDTVSTAWRNATTPPPVVTSFNPPMTSQGTSLRYLTSEQNTEQDSAAPLEALLSATPNTSGSGDNTPQGLKDIHMNIATTTDGTKEKLDSNFRVHRSKYFQPGEVFKVLWSEPEGDTARSSATEVTRYKLETQYKGENVYSSIRRFVIAAADAGHCQCLPILTYGGQATLKWGVKADDHAIIHTGNQAPKPLEGESLSFEPIKVIAKTPRDKLEPESRINYAKIYTVEHNVKVQFIGRIADSSVARFLTDFDLAWLRKRHLIHKGFQS